MAKRRSDRRTVSMLEFAPISSKVIFGLMFLPIGIWLFGSICFYFSPPSLLAIATALLSASRMMISLLASPQGLGGGTDNSVFDLAAIDSVRAMVISVNLFSFVCLAALTVTTIVRYRRHVGEWFLDRFGITADDALKSQLGMKLAFLFVLLATTFDLFRGGVAFRFWLTSLAGGFRTFPAFLFFVSSQFFIMNALAFGSIQMLLYKLFSRTSVNKPGAKASARDDK